MTGYVVRGIDPAPYFDLYGLEEAALAERGVERMFAATSHEAPCRVTLKDAGAGEAVLLLNYEHQPAPTPYRSSHAIFVREGASRAAVSEDALPDSLASRLLSIRAFDTDDMMADAEVIEGGKAESWIIDQLSRPDVAYLHAHNARRGCFAARIDRKMAMLKKKAE